MFFPHLPTYGEIALGIIAFCSIIRATPTAATILHAFFCSEDHETEN